MRSGTRLAYQHDLSVETVNDFVAERLTRIDNRYRIEALALDLEAIGLAQARVMQEALDGDVAAVHALAKSVQHGADLLGTFAPRGTRAAEPHPVRVVGEQRRVHCQPHPPIGELPSLQSSRPELARGERP